MIRVFCDRCEAEMTGESGLLMVLLQQVVSTDKETGPQAQGSAGQTRLGLVCRPCSVFLSKEALRILTTKFAGTEVQ